MVNKFWQTKTLDEMNHEEWESLCDGCGRCCLVKLEDEDNGKIFLTSIACRLLDAETCRCSDYKNRLQKVSDCLSLTPENIAEISWLPETCGYRLVAEGKDLPDWHPLVSGTHQTVIDSNISISGQTVSEALVAEEDLVNFIIDE